MTDNEDNDVLLSNFEKITGKQATDKERERLLHIRDVLHLKNNDAIWLMIMSLESYFVEFSHIPKRHLSELKKHYKDETSLLEKHIEQAHDNSINNIAERLETLCEKHHKTRLHSHKLTTLLLGCIVMTLMCVITFITGLMMGSGALPYWTLRSEHMNSFSYALHTLLAAPAGWICGILLLTVGCTYLYQFTTRKTAKG